MEKVFNQYKNMLVVHKNYQGHVCGYNDSHIILAVETDSKDFFRKLQSPYIMEEYKDYIEEDHYGMDINEPSVLVYIDQVFTDLIQIPGFKYQQIKTKFGLARVYTNLDDLMPFVGRIINQELEEKINFILKVEYELENRLASLNLDKDGKSIQSV